MDAKTSVRKSSLNKLKRKNRKDVLEALRNDGAQSIAEIGASLGLSKVTVNKSLDFYVREGVVNVVGKGESGEEGGKRPNIYVFNSGYRAIFSVKIDEVQILAALTNLDGEILASHTVLYDPKTELDDLLLSMREAFDILLRRQGMDASGCVGVVVGWLGVTDPESGICLMSPHFAHWGVDIPIRRKLIELFPEGMPVYVDNWIKYQAYGEVRKMNPRVDRFFVISTEFEGVNGGLVADGKVYRGFGSLSGEIGHIIVDSSEDAEVCLCGGKGCLEASVSPRRIIARLADDPRQRRNSAIFKKSRRMEANFRQILHAADAGDESLREVIEKSVGFFSLVINSIMQICDPELIIIQGEYAAGGDFFRNRLLERIQRMSLLAMKKTVRIEYSSLGAEGAILGGGLYVADKFFENARWQ